MAPSVMSISQRESIYRGAWYSCRHHHGRSLLECSCKSLGIMTLEVVANSLNNRLEFTNFDQIKYQFIYEKMS